MNDDLLIIATVRPGDNRCNNTVEQVEGGLASVVRIAGGTTDRATWAGEIFILVGEGLVKLRMGIHRKLACN